MLSESQPFFDQLRDATWLHLREMSLWKIIPINACPTIQDLGHSAILYDIFEHDDRHGTLWRVREESDTLKAHFPKQGDTPACEIVPLTSMITLLAVKNRQTSFRCSIGEPLFTGDVIRATPQGIQLIKKDGGEGKFIVESHQLQPGDALLGKDIQIPTDIALSRLPSIELPQGRSFQFVNAAHTSEGHQFFTGTYRIPNEFTDTTARKKQGFDTGLLLEVVAQAGAAVGKNLLPDGHMFVYAGGVFNFDSNIELMPAESLRTSAQLTRNEAGKISYLFCLRRSRDEKPILWGQVDAESIEYARLVRLSNILKKKRADSK